LAKQPTVAVVILNWNGKHYLEKFLPFLQQSSYPGMEIIVADNASTDGSLAFLNEHYPDIRQIVLPENFGFAGGYNAALKEVQSDYYVLLNSDVEVTPGWLEPMVALMESDATIAACQPRLRMYSDKNMFEYAGAAGGYLDSLGYPFARGRVFDYCEEDTDQYIDSRAVAWASGAALMIRPDVYHRCGGLDPNFFAHQEEIDLCWRIQSAGYKIYVCPASIVYHVGGGTLPKGNERKVYLNFRNNLIMLSKNLPLSALWWKLPVRFVLDWISAWKSLAEGERRYFVAIARAHCSVIKWMLGSKKGSLFPEKRRNPSAGWYKGSIVYHHFVKGRKKFSEIFSA